MTLSDALSEILQSTVVHPEQMPKAVRTVLSTLWLEAFRKPKFAPETHIRNGGKAYRDAVRAQLMWSNPDSPSSHKSSKSMSTLAAGSSLTSPISTPRPLTQPPLVCYIAKSQLAHIRRNLFRIVPAPGRKWNEPVDRLQQWKQKCPGVLI